MKVFIYRNLHRKGVVWSVKDCKTNLVVARETIVKLKDVKLKVSQAGRIRVLLQKRKNVHAGASGTWMKRLPKDLKWIKAYYNPYKTETFVDEQGKPILTAKYAKLCKNGLFVAL